MTIDTLLGDASGRQASSEDMANLSASIACSSGVTCEALEESACLGSIFLGLAGEFRVQSTRALLHEQRGCLLGVCSCSLIASCSGPQEGLHAASMFPA